jgi:G3E family GTPase
MIVDVIFGFLGSGKTTFITKVLSAWAADEKIVVLVNEFGDVGIDGEVLSDRGGNVVEMPSGCICCSLQSDFRKQLFDIHRSFNPDRVIIEPSGVATIGTINWILDAQTLEPLIDSVHKVLIVDAAGFKELYKANRRFVESQIEGANLVLLNKCDRVNMLDANLTQSSISSINPDVMVLMTTFGDVDWNEYKQALSEDFSPGKTMHGKMASGNSNADAPRRLAHNAPAAHLHTSNHAPDGSGPHIPHFHDTEAALGYESFGNMYEELNFDPVRLKQLFEKLNTPGSGFGDIVRAKGIFCIGDKWVLMELASGDISNQPIRASQQSKVTIIGRYLNHSLIKKTLKECAT